MAMNSLIVTREEIWPSSAMNSRGLQGQQQRFAKDSGRVIKKRPKRPEIAAIIAGKELMLELAFGDKAPADRAKLLIFKVGRSGGQGRPRAALHVPSHPPLKGIQLDPQRSSVGGPALVLRFSNCRNNCCLKKSLENGELKPYLYTVTAAALVIEMAGKNNVAASKTNGMRRPIHHPFEVISFDTVGTANRLHASEL